MIFNEIYGTYYNTVSKILQEAVRGTLTAARLYSLIHSSAFGESVLTMPEGLAGEKWMLLRRDLSTPLTAEPELPLTLLEKRWLKAVLLDPRIRLFDPDLSGLEEVEPLFDPQSVVYYERSCDGDDFADPCYREIFRKIMDALENGRDLSISYSSKHGGQFKIELTPRYLEYSEKDDRFRLVGDSRYRQWILNLGSVTECTVTEREHVVPVRSADTSTVTFELEDRRHALERVLLHFSHLEKETVRLDNDRYLVTLKYDSRDEAEILIRIMAFGCHVRVTSPESFVEKIRERIIRQMRLSNFLPGTVKR